MKDQGASESGFHFMGDYLTCQQLFSWKHIHRLEPMHTAPALMFGTSIHEGLAAWYELLRKGEPVRERLAAALGTFYKTLGNFKGDYLYDETFIDDTLRGKRMLEEYAFENAAESWKVLAIEAPLEYIFDTGDKFTGRVDLAVGIEPGVNYIVDHKTTGWSLSNLMRTLNVSDQTCGYLWLWNEVHGDKYPARSMVYNILKEYKGKTECKRHVVFKADADLERFKLDAHYTMQEIASKVSDPDARWTRDTGACFRFNRQCPFLDLCNGVNYEGLIGTVYRQKTV